LKRPLITTDDLCKLFDECIDDLKNGMGTRLTHLASVIQSVAESTSEPFYFSLPQAIGGFGNAIVASRSMIMLPVLPEPIRQRISTLIANSVNEVSTSLEEIKCELCVKENPDYAILMRAMGTIHKNGYKLIEQKTELIPTPSSQTSGEE
jgi:hypothetical protein